MLPMLRSTDQMLRLCAGSIVGRSIDPRKWPLGARLGCGSPVEKVALWPGIRGHRLYRIVQIRTHRSPFSGKRC